MKDDQIAPASTEPRLFLVSPVLHCVSMTALVFLRSSFGYGYLRPKSIFFAITWAFALYAIYAWIDGEAWTDHRALLRFGICGGILYWFHLGIAIVREWQGRGEHDSYSGSLHLIRLLRLTGKRPTSILIGRWRLWGEPAATVAAAMVLRFVFEEQHLSCWLCFVALCFWTKEALNQWFYIRRKKRRGDMLQDAEESFEAGNIENTSLIGSVNTAARKSRVKRERMGGS